MTLLIDLLQQLNTIEMKRAKIIFGLVIALLVTQSVNAQRKKILVTDIPSNGIASDAVTVGNLLRFEVEKNDIFVTLDKYDVEEKLIGVNFKKDGDCFGSECLIRMGDAVEVESVLSGSINKMGGRIIISLKLINVKEQKIEKNQTDEFIDYEEELQNMLQITLNNLLELENNEKIEQSLVHYDQFSTPITKLKNSGPRIGLAYIGGQVGSRFQEEEKYGGYDAFPIMSQIGYQIEGQYLNAGEFQALGEMLFMVNGLDQQMFIPSLILMNGFRVGKNGWEFAFGPRFGIQSTAVGYYDDEGIWKRKEEASFTNEEGIVVYEDKNLIRQLDKRGQAKLTSGWVWAFGRTFRSGYLNIPVNIYYSKTRDGWGTGLSLGFNIQGNRKKTP